MFGCHVDMEQSTPMPYNLHGNSFCERFNGLLMDLLKSLSKDQKGNWPLHLASLIFAHNAKSDNTTRYWPYELVFGCKAAIIYDVWFKLSHYNDNYSQNKCEWVNQEHKLIPGVNRHALKRIKQFVGKSVSQAGG